MVLTYIESSNTLLVIKMFLQQLIQSRDESSYKKYGNNDGMKCNLWNTITATLCQLPFYVMNFTSVCTAPSDYSKTR